MSDESSVLGERFSARGLAGGRHRGGTLVEFSFDLREDSDIAWTAKVRSDDLIAFNVAGFLSMSQIQEFRSQLHKVRLECCGSAVLRDYDGAMSLEMRVHDDGTWFMSVACSVELVDDRGDTAESVSASVSDVAIAAEKASEFYECVGNLIQMLG